MIGKPRQREVKKEEANYGRESQKIVLKKWKKEEREEK